MLFMGEEWAASTPWQFFTSHPEPELGRATAEGRIAEFAAMGWDPAVVPDPQDPETFTRSKLDWDERGEGVHARILALYRDLIALRQAHPDLTDPAFGPLRAEADEASRTFRLERGSVQILVNFSDAAAGPCPRRPPHACCSPRTRRAGSSEGSALLPRRSALVIRSA